MSNRAVAHRLGVSEKAIRKLVGPSEPTASAQLALPEITAAVGKPVEIGVPPISVNRKTKGRGRPATGHDPAVAVRLPKPVILAVDKWAAHNEVKSRSEAFRLLLGYGLAAAPKPDKS